MTILTIAFVAVFCWAVFLLPYVLWLRKTTFYTAQRIYLLTSILAGLVTGMLKALHLPVDPVLLYTGIANTQVGTPAQWTGTLNQVLVPGGTVNQVLNGPVFLSVYFVVSIALLGLLIYKIIELVLVVRGNHSSTIEGMRVVESPQLHTPFSFFHLIFLSKERALDERSLKTIIRHEAVHTRQWHSLDIVLTELLLTFTWFCPVILLYKKYMVLLHEYMADANVLKELPAKEYGMLLLSQRMGAATSMAHHFAKSELKNRFSRMVQRPSSPWQLAGFLSLIPLALLSASLIHPLELDAISKEFIPKEVLKDEEDRGREIYVTPDGQWKVVEEPANIRDAYTPRFPGGQQALTDYLVENLHLDHTIKKESKRIIVRINFDTQGKVELITYMRPVHPEMEAELNRVFRSMPAWEIPVVNGKKHRAEIYIPISFAE